MQPLVDPTNNPAPVASVPSIRERIGLVVHGTNAAQAVRTIVAAEAAGVRQVWMAQYPSVPDVLTTFGAAAVNTTSVRLGTGVIPTYPRHPFAPLVPLQQGEEEQNRLMSLIGKL